MGAPCEEGTRVVGLLTLDACWQRAGRVWRADGRVAVNQLELYGTLEIDPANGTVTSDGQMQWTLGGYLIATESFAWSASSQVTVNAGGAIAGLKLHGKVTARFTASDGGSVEIDAHVALPGFGGATGKTKLRASRNQGFEIGSVEIEVGEVHVGPLVLKGLELGYSRSGQRNRWEGGATVVLPALPPRPEVELRASVVDGKLESLFARASLGNRLPLGHGMFLQELRADLVLEPVRISGGAQITVGPEVLGKSLLSLDGDIAWRSGIWEATGKLVIASAAEIDGRVRLNLRPGGPADVDIDGTLDFKRGRSGLTGRVTGWASASAFNAAGTGTLEIADIPAIEGEILVNSSGVAACADWVFGHRLGFDYRWGAATPSRLGESCDVGRLSVPRVTSRSAAAIAGLVSLPRVVTLDEGLPFAVFAAAGAQDSPDILVRGPGGTEYDSRGDSLIDRPDLFVLHTADGTRTVYVAVPKPVAGDWTVSAAPGSDRITEIRVAEGLRKPRIAAKVTRRGPKRALHFTVAQMRGQRVSFYESTSRKAAGAHPVAEGVLVRAGESSLPTRSDRASAT